MRSGLVMKKGDNVWFTDPDDNISSGWYRIDDINGDVYSLSNEHGEVEAFEHELTLSVTGHVKINPLG